MPGCTQLEVQCTDDVLAVMRRGAANRITGETKMNERSSRSHQILTVIVDGRHVESGVKQHSCMHLVDLAGSERVSKSEAIGDRFLEMTYINKSLSALGDVMAALASRERHVPFRNSKLTQLLQDSLSGNAKVMMFTHVAPEEPSCNESVSTLNFAKRVAEVTLGQAKRNMDSVKMFEAQEAVSRAKSSASKQVSQLQAALDRTTDMNRQLLAETAALQEQLHIMRSCTSPAGSSIGKPSVPMLSMSKVNSHPVLPQRTPRSSSASARRYSTSSFSDAGSIASGFATPVSKVASLRHMERMLKAKEKNSPGISNFDRLHASRKSGKENVGGSSSSAMRSSINGLPPLSQTSSPVLSSSRSSVSNGSVRRQSISSSSARSSFSGGISAVLKQAMAGKPAMRTMAENRRSAPAPIATSSAGRVARVPSALAPSLRKSRNGVNY